MSKGIGVKFFFLYFSSAIIYADNIVLVADQWCPYNCIPDSDRPGIMIEIAQYSFELEGHTVTYINQPWARAISNVREGIYDGIVGAGKVETPDFIFPDIELGCATHTLYTRKGEAWTYKGIESLDDITLGAVVDYSYGDFYEDYILSNLDTGKVQLVAGEDALNQNIKKLLDARVDVLIEDKNVFEHYLYKNSESDYFEPAGEVGIEKLYIAFSPKNPKSQYYSQVLSDGIRKLTKSGKLFAILKKYGVNNWGVETVPIHNETPGQ